MLERLKEQERLLAEQERLAEEEVPTYLLILHHHGHDYFRYQKAQHPEIRRRRSI